MNVEKQFNEWLEITIERIKEMKEQELNDYFDEPVTITMTRGRLLAVHTALDIIGQCFCDVGDAKKEE